MAGKDREKVVVTSKDVGTIRAADFEKAEPRIVTATMAGASSRNPARKHLAKLVQDAMSEAIKQAQAEGISDPVEVKARMMAARQKTLAGA